MHLFPVRRFVQLALVSAAFAAPALAQAEVSSTLTLTNNYIWRGISFTSRKPSIQATIDYAHASGASIGTFVANSETTDGSGATVSDSEADYYASFAYPIGGVTLSASAYWYTYIVEPRNNAGEAFVAAAYGPAKLEISYMPKYFDKESTQTYANLTVKQPLNETLSAVGHVGMTSFGDETKVGYKGYVDYCAGVAYSKDTFTTQLTYNNTTRKDLNSVEQMDRAMVASISKTF